MKSLLCLVFFVIPIGALITFPHSVLIDEVDLKNNGTFPITACANGCYIYAALGEQQTDFEHQVVIAGKDGQPLTTLSALARSYDVYGMVRQRFTLHKQPGGYFVVRREGNHFDTAPVAIYAVDKTWINDNGLDLPDIYDPLKLRQLTEQSKQNIVFLSAEPYTITKLVSQTAGSVRVFTAGPEFLLGDDADACFPIFDKNLAALEDDDITIPIRSPIVTIFYGHGPALTVVIKAGAEDNIVLVDGRMVAVTSPGCTGCRGNITGYFRWTSYPTTFNKYYRMANQLVANLSVAWDYRSGDPVRLSVGSSVYSFVGVGANSMTFNARSVGISWEQKHGLGDSWAFRIVAQQNAIATTTTRPYHQPTHRPITIGV